jgi:hypothetical protein
MAIFKITPRNQRIQSVVILRWKWRERERDNQTEA